MSRYDSTGRVSKLMVRGRTLHADVADAVLSGSVDLSTEQVSQINLEFDDPGLRLLGTGLMSTGGQCDYSDLHMVVASVQTKSGPGLSVTARPHAVRKLKTKARTALLRRNVSPTAFVASLCAAHKIRFTGEASARRKTITRAKGETDWECAQRLATEIGYLCFEVSGWVMFARPSWLIAHQLRTYVSWNPDPDKCSPGLVDVPICRRSDDDGGRSAEVTVELLAENADVIRPGSVLVLSGVPTFTAHYLVTGVNIPLSDADPVTITAETPINPAPQPPDEPSTSSSSSSSSGGGSVKTPKAGSYGGTRFTATQLANATAIYRVGIKLRVSTFGIRIAVATACQESSLSNLTGGDRDSVGLFQQRTPWGPYSSRHDPTKAATMFFAGGKAAGTPGLLDIKGWASMSLGAAAQKVQRSAFPGAYTKWGPEATAIVAAIAKTASAASAAGGKGTAEAMVGYALAQAGDRYIYGAEVSLSDKDPDAYDCSELVQWAVARAGGSIPDGSGAQYAHCKRKGTTMSVAAAIKTRGALLFAGPNASNHVAVSLGNGKTIEARGRAYGVVSATAAGRFTLAGKVPGLRYK